MNYVKYYLLGRATCYSFNWHVCIIITITTITHNNLTVIMLEYRVLQSYTHIIQILSKKEQTLCSLLSPSLPINLRTRIWLKWKGSGGRNNSHYSRSYQKEWVKLFYNASAHPCQILQSLQHIFVIKHVESCWPLSLAQRRSANVALSSVFFIILCLDVCLGKDQ